jgi:hypothetical protein
MIAGRMHSAEIQTTSHQWRVAGGLASVTGLCRPESTARSPNLNSCNPSPRPRYLFDVYRAAARAHWVGQVIATSADAAIVTAAVEFRTDVKS